MIIHEIRCILRILPDLTIGSRKRVAGLAKLAICNIQKILFFVLIVKKIFPDITLTDCARTVPGGRAG
jgi:hypothetical protein